jgi:hypothetical protein
MCCWGPSREFRYDAPSPLNTFSRHPHICTVYTSSQGPRWIWKSYSVSDSSFKRNYGGDPSAYLKEHITMVPGVCAILELPKGSETGRYSVLVDKEQFKQIRWRIPSPTGLTNTSKLMPNQQSSNSQVQPELSHFLIVVSRAEKTHGWLRAMRVLCLSNFLLVKMMTSLKQVRMQIVYSLMIIFPAPDETKSASTSTPKRKYTSERNQ